MSLRIPVRKGKNSVSNSEKAKKVRLFPAILVAVQLVSAAAQAQIEEFQSIRLGNTQATPIPASIRVDLDSPAVPLNGMTLGASVPWWGPDLGVPYTLETDEEFSEHLQKWHSLLTTLHEIRFQALHYPASPYPAGLTWKDGIGSYSERPKGRVRLGEGRLVQGRIFFGTDEFLRLCEELGTEAILTVDAGTDSSTAAGWVEYCNRQPQEQDANAREDLAGLRGVIGHRLPYNVKYWAVGRGWKPEDPASDATRLSDLIQAMRNADPSLQIGIYLPAISPEFSEQDLADWMRAIEETCGETFQAWVSGITAPEGNSPFNGPTLTKGGARIDIDHNFPETEEYEIVIHAAATEESRLRIYLDEELTGVVGIGEEGEYSIHRVIESGPHSIRFEAASLSEPEGKLHLGPRVWLVGKTSGADVLHLADSRQVALALTNSAEAAVGGGISRMAETFGKRIWLTRWNTQCQTGGSSDDLKLLINNARFLQLFSDPLFGFATYSPLFGGRVTAGLVKGAGAGHDRAHTTFSSNITYQPTALLMRLLGKYRGDRLLSAKVRSRLYTTGRDGGLILGGVDESRRSAYLQSKAFLSDDGNRLSLFVTNLHPSRPCSTQIHIKGMKIDPTAYAHTLKRRFSHSEETLSYSGGVAEGITTIRSVIPPFDFSFPPQSVTVLVVHRKGSDHFAPQRPQRLIGQRTADGVRLEWWKVHNRDLEGYHVYRSEIPGGPFGNRITDAPITDAHLVDTEADSETTYYYAVRAIDRSGNFSGLSGSKEIPKESD